MAFSTYLHNDPDYKSLPGIIDEELLLGRVQALRSGDRSMVEPITLSLMRITLSCLTRYRTRDDELIGIALSTLQESVIAAATELFDDNIVPYVLSKVNYRIKDYLVQEAGGGVAARTVRDRKAKGRMSMRQLWESHQEALMARPDAYELREELDSLVRTHRQRRILNLKAENYTMAEVAEKMNLGIMTVSRELQDLRDRYFSNV